MPPASGLTAHGYGANGQLAPTGSMPSGKEASCPRAQDTCLTVHSRAYFPGFLAMTRPESQNKED
jgi:hypothetical protein